VPALIKKRKKGGLMKYKKKMLVLFILILILGVTSMAACSFLGIGNTAKWKEEVLLHDGSKIIVERWQKRGGSHEPGQKPGIKEQSISFTLPGTKQLITWKDKYDKNIGRSNFQLVAMHIRKDIPYIIASPDMCLAYNKWGRPNPPYIIFKYQGNVWKRIQLSELPLEFQNVNLVIDTLGDEEELVSQRLTYADKVKEMNSSLTQPEYKTIVRTSIKKEGPEGCPDWNSPRYTSPKSPVPILPKSDGAEKK
jgi:hypothetical protein